jgi:hypothetical protein
MAQRTDGTHNSNLKRCAALPGSPAEDKDTGSSHTDNLTEASSVLGNVQLHWAGVIPSMHHSPPSNYAPWDLTGAYDDV